MYDDLGSFMTLSASYAKKLEEKGVKCISFNRINPILGIIMNHRDHRKIMVIDGKVAFSGGVNLADEYINVKVIHGHWKDNIIRITGPAVWSYTVMFLTHWNALRPEDEDFTKYKVEPLAGEIDGYIAPYGETPLDTEITAQNIYMGILNQAEDYCYIMTPYLIIDTELINALILAAKHGVDVRMITPGVPDKKLVWEITKSYYRQLVEGGVKVYEYTPGFVHAKVFVSDDYAATVGTVNLDYRSLYLHFENGTYLYNSKKVLEVRDDFLRTQEKCRLVTLEETKNGLFKELLLAVLRLFAPLM
jgi:cardiolipin synthase